MSGELIIPNINDLLAIDPTALPAYQRQMYESLAEYNEAAWARGDRGGFRTGFPLLDHYCDGIQPGFYLVAGLSNSGKTAFCIQLAWQLAMHNDDVYVIYVALDDNKRDIIPRVIAQDQRLPINAAKYPARYEGVGDLVERYVAGFRRLLGAIDRFKVIDQSTEASIEQIESAVKNHRTTLLDENKTVIVVIDNFHDLRSDSRNFASDNNKYEYMAARIKELVNTYQVPVICTGELKSSMVTNVQPWRMFVRQPRSDTLPILSGLYITRLALEIRPPRSTTRRKKAVQSVRFLRCSLARTSFRPSRVDYSITLSLNLAI